MAVQTSLNMILPMKSPEDVQEVTRSITNHWDGAVAAAETIGTLHSMRWVALDDTTIGLFTIYDGDFETYDRDFLKFLGQLFDELFTHVVDPPPQPVQKNPDEFVAWSRAHDLPVIHSTYTAYPGLSVQDIKALAAG
jgi:hypothetical protein